MSNFLVLFKSTTITAKWKPTMKSLFKCFIVTVCILMTTGLWGIPIAALESKRKVFGSSP